MRWKIKPLHLDPRISIRKFYLRGVGQSYGKLERLEGIMQNPSAHYRGIRKENFVESANLHPLKIEKVIQQVRFKL